MLGLLAALVVGVSVLFPWISKYLLEPYVFALYGQVAQLGQDNIIIMLLMMGTVLLLPASLLYFRKGRHVLKPYMGGRPTTDDMRFAGSLGHRARDGPPQLLPRGPLQRAAGPSGPASRSRRS